jgi:2-polyprenyl-3-methyl-5-hydroxy-6-metoxy-1,4-benzoquinol methylase
LAIDAADANIQIAKAHARRDPMLHTEDGPSESRLTYRKATSHELVEEGRTFDLVCSLEVIEHVDNPAQFLESCANLVKVQFLCDEFVCTLTEFESPSLVVIWFFRQSPARHWPIF